MKKSIFTSALPCFFILFILFGCARNQVAVSAEIKSYHSGSLHLSGKSDIPKIIYVDLRQGAGTEGSLPPELKKALASKNFQLTDSPSKAGYILHINIVSEGQVDPALLPRLVNAGYGAPAKFSGHGGTALVADALLVQRTVPSSSRPSRARLKNIAARNAQESNQMRLGLISPPLKGDSHLAEADFSRAFAKELQQSISPSPRAARDD